MIPTAIQAKSLWDKYDLPVNKRRHVELVAKVAGFIAAKLDQLGKFDKLDQKLLIAGAFLHDIDKNIPRKTGERHPDTGVRVLREEGMGEVAELVKTHPLHAILDPLIAPKTREQKTLFLADKMVKLEIITVNKRFNLWRAENLPQKEKDLLEEAYPKVKALEKEIFELMNIKPGEVALLA